MAEKNRLELLKLKRLAVELPEDIHSKIKVKAAQRNITIRTWIMRLIVAALKHEEQYE